jgi:catechol 2,3-dioxygenase-like lactoylglutathione lyase family enzyme
MPQSFDDAALTCPQESPMIEINGIAHIQLTVNDLQRAMPFYEDVLGFMGMKAVVKAPNGLYMIGGRTAVAITRSSEANRKDEFDRRRIGLHHLCFRARSKEEIDSLYAFLVQRGVRIVHPPRMDRGLRGTTRCFSKIPKAFD